MHMRKMFVLVWYACTQDVDYVNDNYGVWKGWKDVLWFRVCICECCELWYVLWLDVFVWNMVFVVYVCKRLVFWFFRYIHYNLDKLS